MNPQLQTFKVGSLCCPEDSNGPCACLSLPVVLQDLETLEIRDCDSLIVDELIKSLEAPHCARLVIEGALEPELISELLPFIRKCTDLLGSEDEGAADALIASDMVEPSCYFHYHQYREKGKRPSSLWLKLVGVTFADPEAIVLAQNVFDTFEVGDDGGELHIFSTNSSSPHSTLGYEDYSAIFHRIEDLLHVVDIEVSGEAANHLVRYLTQHSSPTSEGHRTRFPDLFCLTLSDNSITAEDFCNMLEARNILRGEYTAGEWGHYPEGRPSELVVLEIPQQLLHLKSKVREFVGKEAGIYVEGVWYDQDDDKSMITLTSTLP